MQKLSCITCVLFVLSACSGSDHNDIHTNVSDESELNSLDSSTISANGPPPRSVLPAFPGAEGYGADTISGGRGGSVCTVTSLADAGAGTLRECIESLTRPLTIVFAVSGTITLTSSRLKVSIGDLTVAGQTSQGEGIQITATHDLGGKLFDIQETSNVIVRYLKVRPNQPGQAGIGLTSSSRIIIDHASVQWDGDQALTIYRRAEQAESFDNIYQWNLAAEGLAGHSTGSLISGDKHDLDPPPSQGNYNSTWHHNLFATFDHRMPRFVAGDYLSHPIRGHQFINNVIYNWSNRSGENDRNAIVDYINNYVKHGARSKTSRIWTKQNSDPTSTQRLYIIGTFAPNLFETPDADNWIPPVIVDHDTSEIVPTIHKRTRPLPIQPVIPVKASDAQVAYTEVLAEVGDSQRVDCSGVWVARRDAIDLRIVDDVTNDAGGEPPAAGSIDVPILDTETACTDTDLDGMPDAFELLYGLNPGDPTDGSVDSGNGYTNLERYLNGDMRPRLANY